MIDENQNEIHRQQLSTTDTSFSIASAMNCYVRLTRCNTTGDYLQTHFIQKQSKQGSLNPSNVTTQNADSATTNQTTS